MSHPIPLCFTCAHFKGLTYSKYDGLIQYYSGYGHCAVNGDGFSIACPKYEPIEEDYPYEIGEPSFFTDAVGVGVTVVGENWDGMMDAVRRLAESDKRSEE